MDPEQLTPTIQLYAGLRWYLSGRYYRRDGELLHRRVYIDAHGNPGPGWHVHHRNHDRHDNRLTNLEARVAGDHLAHHSSNPTDAQRAARSSNAAAASAGNANLTPEQRADAAARGWVDIELHLVVCASCGHPFRTPFPSRARYCGGTCRARARRARLAGG